MSISFDVSSVVERWLHVNIYKITTIILITLTTTIMPITMVTHT